MKTALMVIHEWVQKNPHYVRVSDVQDIGVPTAPRFRVTVKLTPRNQECDLPIYTGVGEERTKKKAEQIAGTELMRFMDLEFMLDQPPPPKNDLSSILDSILKRNNPGAGAAAGVGNSVGKAAAGAAAADVGGAVPSGSPRPPTPELDSQEMLEMTGSRDSRQAIRDYCVAKNLDEPVPKFMEWGPSHCKTFECTIEFQGFKEKGVARTKADAKRIARYRIVSELYAKSRGNILPIAKPNDSDHEEHKCISYDDRPTCDAAHKGEPCGNKLDHSSHQLILEVPGGPMLEVLREATIETIATTFQVIPSNLEQLLQAKGKDDIVAFFTKLTEELKMKVTREFKMILSNEKNNSDSDEEMSAPVSEETNSGDLSDDEEFFSCSSDEDLLKMWDSEAAAAAAPEELNKFLCNVNCEAIGLKSGKPISVSSFGLGCSEPAAYKNAVVEILQNIAVLMR